MNATELRTKDDAALAKELEELLRAHFNLRMRHATQQLAILLSSPLCVVTSRG